MWKKRRGWLILLLLTAAFLRWHLITESPPGMTHDEADHGLDAWGVVQGIRPIYFTVGYGREPLFDYSTAGLMAFLGPTFLAGRLTATFYSLLLIAGTYAWTRRAFGPTVAMLTAAELSFSFWPLMTARQALRSITMPALFTLAVLFFWQASMCKPPHRAGAWRWYAAAGVCLGLSFYSYLPARLLWLLFPAMLVYWALTDRPRSRRIWRGTLALLLVAGAMGFPLFHYLRVTPSAEIRLSQLSGPLSAAQHGDFAPLLHNTLAGLRLLTIEGDPLWRYNLPGRPLLTPLWGWLFWGGVLLALGAAIRSRRYRSAAMLALLWLGLGLTPVLVTGVEAAVTRSIGMQPAIYLFPALTLAWSWQGLGDRLRLSARARRLSGGVLAGLWLTGLLANTWSAYFVVWTNAPQVRVQYETTLVEMMHYLNQLTAPTVAAISSPQPDRYHDPATAAMTLRQPQVSLRWFNGQNALLLPNSPTALLLSSAQAALNPIWQPWLASARLVDVLPLRLTDEDRPILVYRLDGPAIAANLLRQFHAPPDTVTFGDAPHVTLLGYHLNGETQAADNDLEVLTLWRMEQPVADAVLFTHVQGADGVPVAQQDRLDAPSAFWQSGDYFVQRHVIRLPADLPPGRYPVAIGFYTRPTPTTAQRLPVFRGGLPAGDILPLAAVTVTP